MCFSSQSNWLKSWNGSTFNDIQALYHACCGLVSHSASLIPICPHVTRPQTTVLLLWYWLNHSFKQTTTFCHASELLLLFQLRETLDHNFRSDFNCSSASSPHYPYHISLAFCYLHLTFAISVVVFVELKFFHPIFFLSRIEPSFALIFLNSSNLQPAPGLSLIAGNYWSINLVFISKGVRSCSNADACLYFELLTEMSPSLFWQFA